MWHRPLVDGPGPPLNGGRLAAGAEDDRCLLVDQVPVWHTNGYVVHRPPNQDRPLGACADEGQGGAGSGAGRPPGATFLYSPAAGRTRGLAVRRPGATAAVGPRRRP